MARKLLPPWYTVKAVGVVSGRTELKLLLMRKYGLRLQSASYNCSRFPAKAITPLTVVVAPVTTGVFPYSCVKSNR